MELHLLVVFLFASCLVMMCSSNSSEIQSFEEVTVTFENRMSAMENYVISEMNSLENRLMSNIGELRTDVQVIYKTLEKLNSYDVEQLGTDENSIQKRDTDHQVLADTSTIKYVKLLLRRVLSLQQSFGTEKNILRETKSFVFNLRVNMSEEIGQTHDLIRTVDTKIDNVTEDLKQTKNANVSKQETCECEDKIENLIQTTNAMINKQENCDEKIENLTQTLIVMINQQKNHEEKIKNLTQAISEAEIGLHSSIQTNSIEGKSCLQIRKSGFLQSGIYQITVPNMTTFQGYCDMETDGGGWLIFQRRQNGKTDFNRTWGEYREGFGDLNDEFWLGNERLHQLTQTTPYEMRIDMWDWEGETRHIQYGSFYINSEDEDYKLNISQHSSGTTGNNLRLEQNNTGRSFSTTDQGHRIDCSKKLEGAWWYGWSGCGLSNLNGPYHTGGYFPGEEWWENKAGMIWWSWKGLN